jgi:hypothetical protein
MDELGADPAGQVLRVAFAPERVGILLVLETKTKIESKQVKRTTTKKMRAKAAARAQVLTG